MLRSAAHIRRALLTLTLPEESLVFDVYFDTSLKVVYRRAHFIQFFEKCRFFHGDFSAMDKILKELRRNGASLFNEYSSD